MPESQPLSSDSSPEESRPDASNPEGELSDLSSLSRTERQSRQEEVTQKIADLERRKREQETLLQNLAAADREDAFREAQSLLKNTDAAAVIEGNDDKQRRLVLRNVKDILSAVGLKFSLEELERKANPPKRKKKPKTA